jgi:hypothetical protein
VDGAAEDRFFFTIGHSVTLSLAALNLSPPATIMPATIALSIVFVGADILAARGATCARG